MSAGTPGRWPGPCAARTRGPRSRRSGQRAEEIVESHATDCRLGGLSPPAPLEKLGARALLLGAGHDACTRFHPAEYRIPAPRVPVARPGPDGWEVVTEVAISADRFDELGHDFGRDRPVVRRKVGAAAVRLFPVADAVAYADRWPALHRPGEEWMSDPRVRRPNGVPRLWSHAK